MYCISSKTNDKRKLKLFGSVRRYVVYKQTSYLSIFLLDNQYLSTISITSKTQGRVCSRVNYGLVSKLIALCSNNSVYILVTLVIYLK